eukprot:403355528
MLDSPHQKQVINHNSDNLYNEKFQSPLQINNLNDASDSKSQPSHPQFELDLNINLNDEEDKQEFQLNNGINNHAKEQSDVMDLQGGVTNLDRQSIPNDQQNLGNIEGRLGSMKIIQEDDQINKQESISVEVVNENQQIDDGNQKEFQQELENSSVEDLRQMILDRRLNIQMREQQIRDMQNMLRDTNNQFKKVSQVNMANEYDLQNAYGKLEKRQEAMSDLLKMKEELFTRLQKVQQEVDEMTR